MKTKTLFVCTVLTALMLASCSKNEKPRYDYDYLPVQISKNDDWSIIDKEGKEIIKEEYPADAHLSTIVDGVFWVKQGDSFQLFSIDQPKKSLMDEEFKQATPFCAGRAVVSNVNQPISILDTKGNTVATLPKDISRCYRFEEDGYAIVQNADGLMGLIDAQGKMVLKPAYVLLHDYDGIFLALDSIGSKSFSIIDLKGKKLGEIDITKYTCYGFSENKGIVESGEGDQRHVSVLDKTGKKLFDVKKARKAQSTYYGGYFVFANEDNKLGVADDKGEIMIRAKYDGLLNLGNGLFVALKGDKCGVVDANDETVLPYDYTDGTNYTLGGNFIMKDGTERMLVDHEGKEIISFYENGRDDIMYKYVEYVNIENLVNGLVKQIELFEQPETAEKVAVRAGLKPEDCEYKRDIENSMTIGDKLHVDCRTWFAEPMAEEKTHVEKVNDGWFTEERKVSDGYHWKSILPSAVFLEFTVNGLGVSAAEFHKELCAKLAAGRTKQSDQEFTKSVMAGGQTLTCQTEAMTGGDHITINLRFQHAQ